MGEKKYKYLCRLAVGFGATPRATQFATSLMFFLAASRASRAFRRARALAIGINTQLSLWRQLITSMNHLRDDAVRGGILDVSWLLGVVLVAGVQGSCGGILGGRTTATQILVPPPPPPPPEPDVEEMEREKKIMELPLGPDSQQVFDYSSDSLKDTWNPEAEYLDRAFDYLTPTGSRLFAKMIEFIGEQKKPEFQAFAQPLQCVSNVAYLMRGIGYEFPDQAGYSIPHFLSHLQAIGGQVHNLPKYDPEINNRYDLVDYFARHFPKGLPTGAVITGCQTKECLDEKPHGGHMALLGDKNEYGHIMIYHNNWLRPNNLKGQRIPYMVSLENLYMLLRPREWMATPWVYILQNDEGKTLDFLSILPQLNDLDPLSGDYHIKIALLPQIVTELVEGERVPHHIELATGNQHINARVKEKNWQVCRANKGLKHMDARLAPGGEKNTAVLEELAKYKDGETFLDYRFEFASLGEEDGWISALVYDAGRYWGGGDNLGGLWLDLDRVKCEAKGFTH